MKANAAVIQMSFSDNTEENVEKGARLIKQAAAEGAEIICLPELATNVYFPFEIDAKWLKLAERIPGSRFALLEDCGHMAMWERPEELSRLVKQFLDE